MWRLLFARYYYLLFPIHIINKSELPEKPSKAALQDAYARAETLESRFNLYSILFGVCNAIFMIAAEIILQYSHPFLHYIFYGLALTLLVTSYLLSWSKFAERYSASQEFFQECIDTLNADQELTRLQCIVYERHLLALRIPLLHSDLKPNTTITLNSQVVELP